MIAFSHASLPFGLSEIVEPEEGTVKIIPLSLIKDGGERYEQDTEYEVDDEVGRRFVILGWATSPDYSPPGVEPPPTTVDVTPNSVTHTASSTNPQGV